MSNIAIDDDQLLAFLQNLININSVNPSLSPDGKGEEDIAFFIGNFLKSFGLWVEYEPLGKHRMNVIGTLKGTGGGKTLLLNGHTDTVSVEGMDIPPFEAEYRDGKVYGRGAHDMKGGIAAMIMAVKAVVDAGVQLKGDVILACVADEEYTSKGTESLVKKLTADAAVLVEPSELALTIAHKGFAWTKVEITGKAAHGSLHQEGIDAILKAAKFLCAVEELEKKVLPQKKHPLLGRPSIHASLITGGKEISTYPDKCIVELERRTIPGENRDTVVGEMDALLDKLRADDRDFKAHLDVYFQRPPLEISRDETIVKCIDDAFRKVMEKAPEYTAAGHWMDSAIMEAEGIPTVIFGPKGHGAHAAVEYIEFDSVVSTAKVLEQTILDFCG